MATIIDDARWSALRNEQKAHGEKGKLNDKVQARGEVWAKVQKWERVEGCSFQIPSNIDTNKIYLAAMCGFTHTQQLGEFWLRDGVFQHLEAFSREKEGKFGNSSPKASTPPVHMDRVWREVTQAKYHAAHILRLNIPITTKDIGAGSSSYELVMIVTLILTARKVIEGAPDVFDLHKQQKGPVFNGIPADYWGAAISIVRAFARLRTKDKPIGHALTIQKKQQVCLLIPINFLPPVSSSSASGNPQAGTGVLQQSTVSAIGAAGTTEEDYSENEFDIGTEKEPLKPGEHTATAEAIERAFQRFERFQDTFETFISIGQRLRLSDKQRDDLVKQLYGSLKVLTKDFEPFSSDEDSQQHVALAEALEDIDEGESTLMHVDPEQKPPTFALDTDLMPTYPEACQELKIKDPEDPEIDLSRPGRPHKVRLHFWQVIGVAWILRITRAGRGGILGDDCGVGKTIQALAALALLALDAAAEAEKWNLTAKEDGRPGNPQDGRPSFRPTLLVVPSNVINVWWLEISKFFAWSFKVKIWHRTSAQAGSDTSLADATLPSKVNEFVKWIDSLDKYDPSTASTLIITSYTTSTSRALYEGGRLARGHGRARGKKRKRKGDDDAGEIDEKKTYSTPLKGKFARVWADEAHRAKNEKTFVHKFLQVLEPAQYFFFTATPMPNSPKDMLGYLLLLWKPEWKYKGDQSVDDRYGLSGDVDDPDTATTGLEPSIESIEPEIGRHHLDPDVYRTFLVQGNMRADVAAKVLPLVWRQCQLRRDLKTTMDLQPGKTIRIGQSIPKYTVETVELALSKVWAPTYADIYKELSLDLHGVGADESGDPEGRINMLAHKRLAQATLHVDFYRLEQRLAGDSDDSDDDAQDTSVRFVNQWRQKKDHGATFWQYNTQIEVAPIYRDRTSMIQFIAFKSPKMKWLAKYVLEKYKAKERVLVYVEWPSSQWIVEMFLALLGFQVSSLRSAVDQNTRNEVIARCNNPDSKIDVLVASLKTSSVGINIQRGINNVVFLEFSMSLADIFQAIGRVHRLQQPKEQEIKIVTLDKSYDLPQQYRNCNKYVPLIVGSSGWKVPDKVTKRGDAAVNEWYGRQADLKLQRLLGQRDSRLKCGNQAELFSFEEHPPGQPVPKHVRETFTKITLVVSRKPKRIRRDALVQSDEEETAESEQDSNKEAEEETAEESSESEEEDYDMKDVTGQIQDENPLHRKPEVSDETSKRPEDDDEAMEDAPVLAAGDTKKPGGQSREVENEGYDGMDIKNRPLAPFPHPPLQPPGKDLPATRSLETTQAPEQVSPPQPEHPEQLAESADPIPPHRDIPSPSHNAEGSGESASSRGGGGVGAGPGRRGKGGRGGRGGRGGNTGLPGPSTTPTRRQPSRNCAPK